MSTQRSENGRAGGVTPTPVVAIENVQGGRARGGSSYDQNGGGQTTVLVRPPGANDSDELNNAGIGGFDNKHPGGASMIHNGGGYAAREEQLRQQLHETRYGSYQQGAQEQQRGYNQTEPSRSYQQAQAQQQQLRHQQDNFAAAAQAQRNQQSGSFDQRSSLLHGHSNPYGASSGSGAAPYGSSSSGTGAPGFAPAPVQQQQRAPAAPAQPLDKTTESLDGSSANCVTQ